MILKKQKPRYKKQFKVAIYVWHHIYICSMKKLTILERLVYFFDLCAYERRIKQDLKVKDSRINYLETLLLAQSQGKMQEIVNFELFAIEQRIENKKRLEDLIKKSFK